MSFPTALPPPTSNPLVLDDALWQSGIRGSRSSPRGRIILPLHRQPGAVVQRMLNFLQPVTYVRPHRHPRVGACESIAALAGAVRFFLFDATGAVIQCADLVAGTPRCLVDFEGDLWHTFLALQPDTVVSEIKLGPYSATEDKEFAPWSPEEFTAQGEQYRDRLLSLRVEERVSH